MTENENSEIEDVAFEVVREEEMFGEKEIVIDMVFSLKNVNDDATINSLIRRKDVIDLIEEMYKPYNPLNNHYQQGLREGYNQALQDLKQKLQKDGEE